MKRNKYKCPNYGDLFLDVLKVIEGKGGSASNDEIADKVAPLVQSGEYDRAVLICGTGAGMSVVANKYKGVHAVACESVYSAKMCRAINNANVLCMGGWIVGPEMAVEMVKTFLATDWCQDLEDWRKENMKKFAVQIDAIENKIYG